MKTIEQIARDLGDDWDATLPEDKAFIESVAKSYLAAWLAQQTPVAWLLGRVVDSFAADGYETCTEAEAKSFGGFPVFLAPPPAVQEGYVIVPKEPTEEMCAEGCLKVGALYGHHGARSMYQAMIAAAQGEQP